MKAQFFSYPSPSTCLLCWQLNSHFAVLPKCHPMDLKHIGGQCGRRVFCTGISSLLLPSPKLFWLWFSNLFLLCVRSMFYHQLPRGGSHRNRRALRPEPQQQQQQCMGVVSRRVYIKHARQSRNDILVPPPPRSYQSQALSHGRRVFGHTLTDSVEDVLIEMINSGIVHTQVVVEWGRQAMEPFG